MNLRVYFPEHDLWGFTTNVSLEGCFVQADKPVSEGFLANLLVELPIIGVLSLKGYIHHSGEQGVGMGMQFVQVRFARDQSDYYAIYANFIKIMSRLEKVRGDYLDFVQKGILKLQTFPEKERS